MRLFCQTTLNPSLPQHDPDQNAREAQLTQAKQIYAWDYSKENLKTIPMAAESIYTRTTRNIPSLKWFIKVLEIALRVLENRLSPPQQAPNKTPKQSKCVWVNLCMIIWHLLNMGLMLIKLVIRDWSNAGKHESKPLTPKQHGAFFWDFTKAIFWPMLPNHTYMQNSLGTFYTKYTPYFLDNNRQQHIPTDKLAGFKSIFKTIAIPETAQQLLDDASFARYRLAGPNPMLLQGIKTIPTTFKVDKTAYAQVMAGDSLTQALKEQRVYLLDYHALTALADHPGVKYVHKTDSAINTLVMAPIALFALSPDRQTFKAVAIQCYQNANTQPTVFATSDVNDPHYWDWQRAKSLVQNADANYHELLVHLARTHLLIEAFAVATPAYLAKQHPVAILLAQHLEGSLFINSLAEKFLVGPGGNVDDIFGADIQAVQAAAGAERLNMDFYAAMLPNDLKHRQLDDPELFPDYPYRDDGLLIWHAISDWVKAYLALYYEDDAAIKADPELATWATALMTEGKVKGFTAIQSLTQLTEVLTMVIFTASAQHAAVNFPQSSVMSYTPAFPGSLVDVQASNGATEDSWLSILPPQKVAQAQLDLFQLLGSVYYAPLGQYHQNRRCHCALFTDPKVTAPDGPLVHFQSTLKDIEKTIQASNKTRVPYTFLLPSNIPASINI